MALAGFAVGAVKSFLETGEALDKMSKRTGFSVEALGELKFAAEQSGSSIESIEKATKKMSAVIFDAGDGMKSAEEALASLGAGAPPTFKGLSPKSSSWNWGQLSRKFHPKQKGRPLLRRFSARPAPSCSPCSMRALRGCRSSGTRLNPSVLS